MQSVIDVGSCVLFDFNKWVAEFITATQKIWIRYLSYHSLWTM